MRILILGAAAGGGFPQWNANNENCRRARSGDPATPPQTQSSIAVSADGTAWCLCNASPDLRQQIEANRPLQPSPDGPRRASPIAAAVLTNADIDHIAGLLNLRESQNFQLYATTRVQGTLAANSVFNVLNPDYVHRQVIKLDTPFSPLPGLSVTAFAVPGKVALYLEDRARDDFGTQSGDTVGLEIQDTASGRNFFYIPGCAGVTPELAERLRNAPLVLFDGTLYTDDEMIRAGEGVKTGQRMGHISMSGPQGSIHAFQDLRVSRRLFIHLNNTNPVLDLSSPERAAVEASGWEVAMDGMEIAL
ncbi:MAG: pyrroloquinoline quinone biosynthesis protein PqqB [Alphaproteobacteria bacterium]|nr:pyrroloquinoline quinone biosynthesis protein PqqB [Alphaproteobacteria bacterium]